MALVAYRKFLGEIPRTEPHLLPSGAAQEARNCIFTSGVLQSAKGGLYLKDMQANPVKGLYTEDGLNFYSWPSETRAFRSPIKEDAHNRMYFLSAADGIFKVTSRLNMTANGITPLAANCFRVGVPAPVAAPVLTLVDRTTLPDNPNAYAKVFVFWEDAGQRYDRHQVDLVTVTKFKKYQFKTPARSQDTPEYATLKVQFIFQEEDKILAQVTLDFDDAVVSQTFPGTQEYLATKPNNTTIQVAITWGVYTTSAYQYTFSNEWSEEGVPSPAAFARPTYLQDVKVKITPTTLTGFKPVTKTNIYKTFGATDTYVNISLTPSSDGTYLDASREATDIGSALVSQDYDAPLTGLNGAELSANGIFALFKGNTLYLTEPYLPHAASYIYSFSHSIRSVHAVQQAFIVTTADGVYLLAGVNPGSMQSVKLPQPQPGIAQRSIVEVDGGAVYASGDGLVAVNGTATSMALSQELFGREKWRQMFGAMLRDASIRLSFYDGHLVASSDQHANGFVLLLEEMVGSLSRHSQRMDCTFQLPVEDALFYSDGRKLYQYQAGADLEFYWRGKDEIFAQGEVFGAGYLRASGPVQLMLWCDGVLVYDQRINPGNFRLPATMPRCLRLSVGLKGTGKVQELCLARSMTELRNG